MPYDDDDSVRPALSDREADAMLHGPELAGFVADLQDLASETPKPSAELLAMLSGGLVPDPTAVAALPRVRRRRWVLVPVPLAALLVGGTVGAASANALPDGAQRVVSDAVSSITPIHLPRPADKPAPLPAPVTTPADSDVPGEDPEPTPRLTPHPTARPADADDRDDDRPGQAPDPRRTPEHPARRSPSAEPRDDDGQGDERSGSGGDDHHEDGGSDHQGR